MKTFDEIVELAIADNQEFATVKTVVEKEILHFDILEEMNNAGYLKNLTFIGGTCLRDCYNSPRMSEDLDFTGGFDFSKDMLYDFSERLKINFLAKYGFPIEVSEPKKETGNTETWKIKITTRPEKRNFPAQKINIDICLLPSYDRKSVWASDYYGLEKHVLLFAESLKEIFADKIIAFARRPNRVKFRDLWDINYLSQKKITLDKDLLSRKLQDRKIPENDFWDLYKQRISEIVTLQQEFLFEMRRFLLPSYFTNSFVSPQWWQSLINIFDAQL
jgi:predicted nucleotidyltransferase component of viral defense system